MRVPLAFSLCTVSLLLTGNAVAQNATIRRPDIGLAFMAPTGYKKVPSESKTYHAEKPDGSRILIRWIAEDPSNTPLPKGASAAAFARLHGGKSGKVLASDSGAFAVGGATSSVALVEYNEGGKPRQSCHILTANQGKVCLIEYSAPTAIFRQGFDTFNKTVESVAWLPVGGPTTRVATTAKPKAVASVANPLPKGPSFGGTELVPGVLFKEIQVPRPGNTPLKLYVYMPAKAHTLTGLPCVLIAPAGSRMFHGMKLAEGDQAEEYPYAMAGFAVVAYEVDGPLEKQFTNSELVRAGKAFVAAHGGVENAKTSLDYAINYLRVDPDRVYVAGHSSAATIALQVAENEPRIKGCIAYAPVVDLEDRLDRGLGALNAAIPGFKDYVMKYSPDKRIDDFRCPLFLFQSKEDGVINTGFSKAFAGRLQRKGVPVTFVEVPTGDHYSSMIEEGIPQGITWLRLQAKIH